MKGEFHDRSMTGGRASREYFKALRAALAAEPAHPSMVHDTGASLRSRAVQPRLALELGHARAQILVLLGHGGGLAQAPHERA